MGKNQDIAEDIIGSLLRVSEVDGVQLLLTALDQLDDTDQKRFVGSIKDAWELYEIDEAREMIMDDGPTTR